MWRLSSMSTRHRRQRRRGNGSWPLCVKKGAASGGRMLPRRDARPSAKAICMVAPRVVPALPAPDTVELSHMRVWSGDVCVTAVTVAPLAACPSCGSSPHGCTAAPGGRSPICRVVAWQSNSSCRCAAFSVRPPAARARRSQSISPVAVPYARQTARLGASCRPSGLPWLA
jgi:hypothetical protein